MFDINGRFYHGLTKFANLVILNVYFIITSLPVFTIGASMTALIDVTMKMARGEEGEHMTPAFFGSFRTNFKRMTVIWLICLAVLVVAAFDFCFGWNQSGPARILICTLSLILFLLALMMFFFACAWTAVFESTLRDTFKNAAALSLGKAPQALLATALLCVPVASIFLVPNGLTTCLILTLVIWEAADALLAGLIFNRLLAPYLPDEEEEDSGAFAALDELEQRMEQQKEEEKKEQEKTDRFYN